MQKKMQQTTQQKMQQNNISNISVSCSACGDPETELGSRLKLLRTLCISVLLTMPLLWNLRPGIQLAIATVIQFWPGQYFYKGAWTALKQKVLGMDLLVALSTTVIYVHSAYTALTVHNNVKLYFLSEGVLLSLILFGKYMESTSRYEASEAIRKLILLQPETANVLRDGVVQTVGLEELVPEDIIVIRDGERSPIDGTVIDGECQADESMLTGESALVSKEVGSKFYCGTLCRKGSAHLSCKDITSKTMLGQIIDIVTTAQSEKAPVARLTDKIATIFVPVVILVAVGIFFLRYYLLEPGDLASAVNCVCSTLVIACPCALGLATPTSIMTGSGRGAELGVLFRGGEQLETAYKTDAVVFDKTGTLTYGLSEKRADGEAGGLAGNKAVNPANSGTDGPAKGLAESPVDGPENCGTGGLASSRADSGAYGPANSEAGGPENCGADGPANGLSENPADGPAGSFPEGEEQIRDGAVEAISALKARGMEIWMISGDKRDRAELIAGQLGIDNLLCEVKPSDKAEAVKNLQAEGKHVCFVGDGINDSPAIACADIGIALACGTDIAISASDVMIVGSDLSRVETVFDISSAVMRNVRQNLIWAVIYNAICIPLAAAGIINPSIAAAAMALSSNGVLLNSLRLKKFGRKNDK